MRMLQHEQPKAKTEFPPSAHLQPHPSFPESDHSHVRLLHAAKMGDSSRRPPTPTAPHAGRRLAQVPRQRTDADGRPGDYAGLIRHGATPRPLAPAARWQPQPGGRRSVGNYAIGDGDDSSGRNSAGPNARRADGGPGGRGGGVCGGFAGSLH